jgi:sterol desaturase/sphingolipid hydroxylase (fatty acid hydroxylase superfamily)
MDLTRPDLFGGLLMAALFVAAGLWESERPLRNAVAPAGRRWMVNLALYAISIALMIMVPAIATRTVWSDAVARMTATPAGRAAHLLATLFALDLLYYFGHRAFHRFSWLWRIHSVHHTDLDLDVTTTLRHHPAEGLLFAIMIAAVGGLLGASAGEIAVYGGLAFAVQLFAHANVAIPSWLESKLGLIFVTAAFHRLHHSQEEREANSNFAEVFAFWDRLFGTAVATRENGPAAYGVARYLDPRHQQLGWILLQPMLPTSYPSRLSP